MQGPQALSNAQIQVALKPVLGGEIKVFVTKDPALELANIEIVAANSGINNTGSPYAFNITSLQNLVNGYPMDLIVVLETPLSDTGPVTIVVFGLDQNSVVQSGVAVIKTPSFADVTDQVFEKGWAVDVVPTVPTNQWTSYTGVSIQCTAQAQYASFSIWAMPNLTRYSLIGATQEKSFTTRSQQPTPISAGLDEAQWIKPGVIPVGSLQVRQRWVSFNSGLARFDGNNVTARIDVVKELKIVDQRIFAMGGVLTLRPNAGELASVGEFAGDIMYSELALMCPQASGS